MNFLLKIVEGPMKGAEIALVTGLRLKVGSGDDCDIVLADSALAPVAFELDVGETSVSLIAGTETKALTPYEIFRSGASGFAIGPAEGAWQPLVDPEKAAKEKEEEPVASAPSRTPEAAAAPEQKNPKEESAKPAEEEKKRRGPVGCLLFILLLLVVFGALVWYFWPRLVEKYRQRMETSSAAVAVPSVPTLAEIAADHGLTLVPGDTDDPRPLLTGNVRRRTERLAIRALALASDPTVKFDLTDDETLQKASDELLFVVSEGRLKAPAATNRVVTLAGYAPTAAALEKAIRALNADVKGIAKLDTAGVQLGGVPPASPDAPKAVFAEPTEGTKVPRAHGAKTDPARDYPIAGILTVPYPCVVLRDGMRLTEGATLGNATIVRIEAGKLVLRAGKTTFEWRP